MKKLLICLCCTIALINIIGCSKENTSDEDENIVVNLKDENIIEKSKADINYLFSDIQEIDFIRTMRIDIQYTLDTKDQIDKLMKLLQEIEYTEFDTGSADEVKPEPKATGSRSDGIALVFHYTNGSTRKLALYSTDDGEFVEYTEVTDTPYSEKTSTYTTTTEVWNDVLLIMKKGNKKDLNQK